MFAAIFIFATNCILTGHSQDYSLRLTNPYGNSSKEGRLEISYLGVWGTVCDDGFTDENAKVACASLGYGYNGAVIGNRYGAGSGQIWLEDVSCTETEIGTEQCFHLSWGEHNCNHSEDVSISCDCTSRVFNERSGYISSPNYPRTYANNLLCYTYIRSATGQKVIITFLAFHTQVTDWVVVTCESGNTSGISAYSGARIPAVLTLTSCNYVKVEFNTDNSTTYAGFNLSYNLIPVLDNDMDPPNSLGMILGASLGAFSLIVIAIFVILLNINYRQQKSVGDVGHKIKGELHQPYETSITNSDDANKHAYDDLEGSDHYESKITNSNDAETDVYDDLQRNDHHKTDIANSDDNDTNAEGSLYYPGRPRPQSIYPEIYDEIDH